MSDMTDEKMIEVLRKEGQENRMEIKGLRDIEDFRVSVIRKLETEIKALKESRDELLEVAIEYSEELYRNEDDETATQRVLNEVIQKAEALKDKEA